MKQSFIAIIGEYSAHLLDHKIQDVLANNEAEINVFDFPVIGGKDTVERVSERLLVHKYACPSNDIKESITRDKEYIRDMIYLGAKKYYLCKPKEKRYTALYKSLEAALSNYGVEIQVLLSC